MIFLGSGIKGIGDIDRDISNEVGLVRWLEIVVRTRRVEQAGCARIVFSAHLEHPRDVTHALESRLAKSAEVIEIGEVVPVKDDSHPLFARATVGVGGIIRILLGFRNRRTASLKQENENQHPAPHGSDPDQGQ
ncbi:hypothetical protein EB061_07375 [bacterium]|nr:hypothetical protein [bacterium]